MEKSRMYQLYELRDELEKAIANSKTVEASQRHLVSIILQSDGKDEFQDFIKSMTQNWKDYDNHRLKLNTRLQTIKELIKMYENRDENSELVSKVVTMVLEGIGATSAQSKPEEA